eukprot:5196108-Alexandrium_andersonii.AAC.1
MAEVFRPGRPLVHPGRRSHLPHPAAVAVRRKSVHRHQRARLQQASPPHHCHSNCLAPASL